MHARPRALLSGAFVPACLLSLALLGCVPGRGTKAPKVEIGTWIDEDTIGAPTRDDPERLQELADAGPDGRILRLDRLLDLYDAARFAADKDARDSLWLALGGYSSSRGISASREVVLRLLDEAYALEGFGDWLDADQQRFVFDAIQLLSTDMFLPDSAEALISQTLAYRLLSEEGHPRIADNAHWRLYDHVRGVLTGALEVGPELRPDVAVHALYADREDISAWLEDRVVHARPPLPSTTELWELLARHRDALAAIPRWQAVVAARAEQDAELHDTVLELLPRPRASEWALSELAPGTGVADSLAPVVLLQPGAAIIEPTGPQPQRSSVDDPALVAAIEGALARDGRGIALLAADPTLPAPELSAGLQALLDAGVGTIELAVHEPRLDGDGQVVVALPLYVVRPDELAPGARALREARIHVQLDGRGPRFRVDGRWLSAAPQLPSDLQSLLQQLRRAYPTQRAISLSLAANVQPRQLVDLLAALVGGRDPAFVAVGWQPAVAVIELEGQESKDADRALAARVALAERAAKAPPLVPGTPLSDPKLVVPEGLSEDDRSRLERGAHGLWVCVPELERPLPKQGIVFRIELSEGRVKTIGATAKGAPKARIAALEDCADERIFGLSLRDRLEPTTLEVVFTP